MYLLVIIHGYIIIIMIVINLKKTGVNITIIQLEYVSCYDTILTKTNYSMNIHHLSTMRESYYRYRTIRKYKNISAFVGSGTYCANLSNDKYILYMYVRYIRLVRLKIKLNYFCA